MDRSITTHTFGCKVNTYDTGLIERDLGGLKSEERRIHILNTCAVTAEATKEAVRLTKKLKKNNPDDLIVVTGCASQVDTQKFEDLNEVDLIVANSHKSELRNLIEKRLRGEATKVHKSNIFRNEKLGLGGGLESHHSRIFLKIQDGCNSFCSYCVIPFARGKSRSLPREALAEKISELYIQGRREVVLTGIHIGDYCGKDEAGKEYLLEDLVSYLLKKTKMPRFRLTSLEPPELTPGLLELFKEDRLCSHFHMSIQSATTKTLKSMKRNYTAQDVEDVLDKIHLNVPNAYVGMDVIVGFCGETNLDFEDTYTRLERLPWTRIHVFPYSERSGTSATRMNDNVLRHVKVERSRRLRALSTERLQKKAYDQVGTRKKALVLKGQRGSRALSRDYWDIQLLAGNHPEINTEVDLKITGFHPNTSLNGGQLVGQLI